MKPLASFTSFVFSCLLFSATTQADEPNTSTQIPDPLGPRYEVTMMDGIDFTKPGYPTFLSDVSGISGPEPWGRWTDGEMDPVFWTGR